MAERLDYLQSLGVNALELMPIHEFNELEYYQVRGAVQCSTGAAAGAVAVVVVLLLQCCCCWRWACCSAPH